MPAPSFTYTLTNGTTADASQVMQNFNDILNGVSDGTKDLSISALTAAGTATLNGAVNLGNASSDDLTITASLASTIPIKTTNSYDIGSSTLGLRALFFGANSQTTKIQGSSSMAATYTLTLPTNVATADDYVVKGTTAGVLSFSPPGPKTASGSDADTTLTVTSSRHQIVTPTADRSYTLPTTSVTGGDIWYFTNNASVDSNSYTIIVKSSNGDTVRTVYPQTTAAVMALQDTPTTSSHWRGLSKVSSNEAPYTATISSGTVVSSQDFRWWRDGQHFCFTGYLSFGTGSSGSGSFTFTVNGFTIDNAGYDHGSAQWLGGSTFVQGSNLYNGMVGYTGSTTLGVISNYNATDSGGSRMVTFQEGYPSNGNSLSVRGWVKISGWSTHGG